MMRKCSHCGKAFTPQELGCEESKGMEAERKAQGLVGMLFRYYYCTACGNADIFLDVRPAVGESDESFRHRKEELEVVVRHIHAEGVGIAVVERR
jgi:hypothetical protein